MAAGSRPSFFPIIRITRMNMISMKQGRSINQSISYFLLAPEANKGKPRRNLVVFENINKIMIRWIVPLFSSVIFVRGPIK